MNQKEIVGSLGTHLDSLKRSIGWALGLAVVFLWAGLTRADPVTALGLQIARGDAFLVAAIFYLFVNIRVLDTLLRIGGLVRLLDDDHFVDGTTKLAVHPFLANPFSYFGRGVIARAHSGKGFGLLIFVWWVANSSLYTLANEQSTFVWTLTGGFLVLGLASMVAISRVYDLILKRMEPIHATLHAGLHATKPERALMTFAGIGVGGAFAFLILSMSALWSEPRLSIDVMGPGAPAQVGSEQTYHIVVRNEGPGTAHGVRVVGLLDVSHRAVSLSGTTGGKNAGSIFAFEPVERLPVGASAKWSVVVRAVASGELSFVAGAIADGMSKEVHAKVSTAYSEKK